VRSEKRERDLEQEAGCLALVKVGRKTPPKLCWELADLAQPAKDLMLDHGDDEALQATPSDRPRQPDLCGSL
jgi:hypothetical protein